MITKKEVKRDIISQKVRTQYRRTQEASPIFELSNDSTIGASSSVVFDIGEREPNSKKYLPLSNIRIVNNSTENIAVFINQRSEGVTVPAGTIITLDKGTIPSIYSVKITNLDTSNSISANKIKFSVWREALVIDDAYRRMHKAFYKALYGFK
ncbi:hypothetical protein DRN69_08190 [Candidatus Pacearchaeota archaeon]|nr:MAG: hypothetical protein DRN69_08190 [Candidatus Pacearchaeota archaeon]